MKQKVTYTIFNKDKYLIDVHQVFPDERTACSFFQEIKNISVTKPIIADIPDKKGNNEFVIS